jgi:GNAT superfamily N-acetyltransferase
MGEGKPERASAGQAVTLTKFGRVRTTSAEYQTRKVPGRHGGPARQPPPPIPPTWDPRMPDTHADASAAPVADRRSWRAARAADEPFLRALFDDDRRGVFAATGLPEVLLDRLLEQQYRAHTLGRAQTFPDAVQQVILHGATPIGRLTTAVEPFADRRSLRIVDIVLRPEWRGRGLGGGLLGVVARIATAEGYARLTLSASRADEAVRRFYHRLGFVEIGGDEVHVAMALDLATPPA